MNPFFSSSPVWLNKGTAIVRIIVGLLVIYHGQEVFNPELMKTYMDWDAFKGPSAKAMVYLGKSTELLSGILIFLGLFTRIGALLMMGTLSYITFFVGHGRFWYEDQHPFMFVLFGLLFLFTGPGGWSLDALIFKEKSKTRDNGNA
ncbi:MAG TPA: DoxX family protein [Cyclobacteriaceae bacterium]|nr:DoxX family protein [Cyclobacteriaceae bacterium]